MGGNRYGHARQDLCNRLKESCYINEEIWLYLIVNECVLDCRILI